MLVSHSDRFTDRKTAPCTLTTGGLDGPQRGSGKDGDEKYYPPPPGMEPRFANHLAINLMGKARQVFHSTSL